MTIRDAICQCGQLRLKCSGDAVLAANSRFRREQIAFEGRSTAWVRHADSGNAVTAHFCPTCGSTVYWELAGFPDLIAVAQGMFADPDYPPPTVAVWEETKHGWTDHIAGLAMERFARAP